MASSDAALSAPMSDEANARLLKHANEVRRHANLDTLDAYLGQSGYSWIEMMISHAKDSYETYSSSTHDVGSSMAHAFEHRMAAELLKTPSPKKKRIQGIHGRNLQPIVKQTALSAADADPFTDDNKENEPTTVVVAEPIKQAPAAAPAPTPVPAPAPVTEAAASSTTVPSGQSGAAPKRKLSTLAHAKKSMASTGSTGTSPKARSSSFAPSNIASTVSALVPAVVASAPSAQASSTTTATKSSFLSKSIMRVEQDQRSLDDTHEALASIPDLIPSPVVSHPSASLTKQKRKSEEKEDDEEVAPEKQPKRAAKVVKVNDKTEAKPTPSVTVIEKDVAQTAPKSTQPTQSLREKIESFNTQKTSSQSAQAPAATKTATTLKEMEKEMEMENEAKNDAPKNSRNFSSMSTHSVGLGAAKITSPIFSRSNSQNTLGAEPASPTSEKAKRKNDEDAERQVELLLQQESEEAGAAPSSSSSASSKVKNKRLSEHDADAPASKQVKEVASTTPLNSPGPKAYLASSKVFGSMQAPPPRSPVKSSSPVKGSSPVRRGILESIDQASDSDMAAYDTSSDGDLSLVDLSVDRATAKNNNPTLTIKSNTLAPRPPGTSSRPAAAQASAAATTSSSNTVAKKVENAPIQKSSGRINAFMPSAAKENRSPSRIGRMGRGASEQSTANSAMHMPTTPNGHATWGGSISSKLKGILGFSSATPSSSSHAAVSSSSSASAYQQRPSSALGHNRPASVTSKPLVVPARKDSVLSANGGMNAGSRAQTSEKKPASNNLDTMRKREAEQAERLAKMREKVGAKASTNTSSAASANTTATVEANKKRVREEAAGASATSASVSQAKVTSSSSNAAAKAKAATVGAATGRAMAQQLATQNKQQPEPKRRKSNEGASIPTVAAHTNTLPSISSSQPSKPTSVSAVSKKPSSQTLQKNHGAAVAPSATAAPVKAVRAPSSNNVFSDHNPFQRAQQQQQQQALAVVAQQMQRHKANNAAPSAASNVNASPNSKMKVAATNHIELEEPDSAYSDSEDEETIRRRMQHKPWETREGLARALEAQASVDADMIFGIPQGGVPLDEILPADTDHARVRRMRPRSSSATWSRDGLKQFEIDRYNERMGIQGPGVRLDAAPATGSTSPSRPTGSTASRMSALAQSAIAQGQTTNGLSSSKKGTADFR